MRLGVLVDNQESPYMVALGKTCWPAAERIAERRGLVRPQLGFRVMAWRMDHSLSARRQPRLVLDVEDLTLDGLLAGCQMPMDEGERVTIFFPPSRQSPEWDAFGRVVRCERDTGRYRVTVAFDHLPAA